MGLKFLAEGGNEEGDCLWSFIVYDCNSVPEALFFLLTTHCAPFGALKATTNSPAPPSLLFAPTSALP